MLPFISCVFLFGLSLLCTLFQRIRILTSFDSFFELHQQRCAPGLKCFQRNPDDPVPGCEGYGKSIRAGTSYCYVPPVSTILASLLNVCYQEKILMIIFISFFVFPFANE